MGRRSLCVWHDGKCATNIVKHGYDFFDVAVVFDGRPVLVRRDERFDYGEERFNLLAQLEARIVNVTFARRDAFYHLISARPANRAERTVFDAAQKNTNTKRR